MAEMLKSKGKLIIFSAPSGAGKTTILKQILKKGLNLEFSVSATSRSARSNEIHGKDYYFLTFDEFQQKIKNDEFLEWEEVYEGIFYGTLKSEVERIRKKGRNVVFDVDVVGGMNIKKYYGNEAYAFFIMPPSIEELEKRLQNRSTETDDKIQIRIAKAKYELDFAKQFDVILINDNLEDACLEAEKLISCFLSSSI
ncbi:MAG: guanylate kinase [Bacteroidales bacterium]|jgi:guanylate kinase|nr:guanylate kinase [Bacteroidales bacterium]